MKQEEMIANLHKMADSVNDQMKQIDAFVCIKISLPPDADGNRCQLICGIETVGDDD